MDCPMVLNPQPEIVDVLVDSQSSVQILESNPEQPANQLWVV